MNKIVRILAVLGLLGSMILLPVRVGATASWLGTWHYRIKITVSSTYIDALLTDFPIKIIISNDSGTAHDDLTSIFTELSSDANRTKIAITKDDGTTQCYVEIQQWSDASEYAILWVKVPSVSNSADTILYIYYDHLQSSNTSYIGDVGSTVGESVWDSNYVAVLHLDENGDGTTGEFIDSTGNGHNGTGGDGTSNKVPTQVADTTFGNVQSFDGSNVHGDFISIPDSDAFSLTTTGDNTIEIEYSLGELNNPYTETGYVPFLAKEHVGGQLNNEEWFFEIFNANYEARPQWLAFYVEPPSGGVTAGANDQTGSIAVNSWVSVIATAHDTDASHGIEYLYKDGVHTGDEATWQSYGITYANGDSPVRIGNYTGSYSVCPKARMAEFRYSNITRSDAWIKATSYSNKDGLNSYNSPETYGETTTTTTTPAATYALTMAFTPIASGTATDNTDNSPYTSGSQVSITASPASGYRFVNWTANHGSFTDATAISTTFIVPSQTATVTAHFTAITTTTPVLTQPSTTIPGGGPISGEFPLLRTLLALGPATLLLYFIFMPLISTVRSVRQGGISTNSVKVLVCYALGIILFIALFPQIVHLMYTLLTM